MTSRSVELSRDAESTPAPSVEHPPFQQANGAHSAAYTAGELIPAHLLDGGEIVIFAIKPSLWFVVFKSSRWLAAMVLMILLSGWIGETLPHVTSGTVVQVATMLGAVRVGFGLLQWVSRLYVLTNRRVLRLTGILNLDLFECPLTKIQNTYLTMAWYERITGLGTISFSTAGAGGVEASWTYVNNPLELHERIRSAIHRAQSPGL